MEEKKVGAALILGGGIGGMQAALDLAESGIKVYIVEKESAIGGVMAMLDKTFPTNDCAMCTMAPRLVSIGRHKDIEIISLAKIERVEGEAGNFKVVIKKNPRYVDEVKCTGCGLCFEVCPVFMKDNFNQRLSERKAIYMLYPQAIPAKAIIEKKEKRLCHSACIYRCPANTNVLGYIRLIAEGKFQEAYELNRKSNPFPSVCGRVCYAPCEGVCNRGQLDEPIAIRQLKRFVADYTNIDEIPIPSITKVGKKVAVIGAGPAGLSCANDLALMGYDVTVYEAMSEAGGMLRYGIPEYRLPRDILKKEINYIQKLGVEIKTNVEVGKDISIEEIQKNYDAIFIGAGASLGMKMDVEGFNLEGVFDGIKFLRDFNLGKDVKIGEKVAIVGGGNTAIDCARTAIRLGAKEVTIVYRRSRAEMPAAEEEIVAAEKEGVKINYLTLPTKFIGENNKLKAMECIKMQLGEPDASGRRKPIPIPSTEFIVEVDNVIAALGQNTQLDFLKKLGIALNKNENIIVEPISGATNIEGIFAGGDVVTGAYFVIDAIAAGKRAAKAIDKYIKGEALEPAPEFKVEKLSNEEIEIAKKRVIQAKRVKPKELNVEERINNFKEVEFGFTLEQALEEASRCLATQIEGCIECGECERVCTANAIIHQEQEKEIELNVGSIILAPGFEPYNPEEKDDLGYKKFPNVVTSIEFERILSASGPFCGEVQRPSDNKHPEKIAFIQCVGSREKERDWCSSVCCMYATKEAIMAKEHLGEHLKCDIYFMDVRAFSKGFEQYYESAKKLGINYIRCRIPKLEENPENKNIIINYLTEDDKKAKAEYDMVILSIGLLPPKDTKEISSKFGIELNEFGFASSSNFKPVETKKEGIFIAGPFTEPKDIPETVMQATASASKALDILSDVKGQLIKPQEFPKETDVLGQEPRIGVFVCHCGTNIAGVVNVPEVMEYAKTLPNVVYATNNLYTCSNDTQELIKQKIKEYNLNRVIVASCTPRTHEPLFRNTVKEAGLNPYLFEMANIRDQCSWVHMQHPDSATHKSKDLVRMAVAKARLLEPLQNSFIDITKNALVVGGGIAGMKSALQLANQGYKVFLLEKTNELGGNLKNIYYLLNGEDPQKELKNIINEVKENKNIEIYFNAKIDSVEGSVGNFKTKITSDGKEYELKHGIVIIAVGGKEYEPKEYLYGQDERVITQRKLEEKIVKESFKIPNTVVMIQCVGSREEERPSCSRICCSVAIKNALKLKEISPDTNVYILYRDIRAYGFKEKYYTKARDKGVSFIRWDIEDGKPEVIKENGNLYVKVKNKILNMEHTIPADLIVLSTGIVANEDNKDVAQHFKIPITAEGFFLEAHMKLRPVDFATDGVFLAGLAHFPKAIDESIIQAQAAAARASTILSKDKLELEATISKVIDENCDGCAYCVETCPFKAITLIEYMWQGAIKKTVQSNESLCKGCGTCMATCPKKGIYVKGFTLEQLQAQVFAALEQSQ